MQGLRTFPTRNKNLIFTGIGTIQQGIIIFSWFDRISSLLKDKINEVFLEELETNSKSRTHSPRTDRIIQVEEIEWKLYIWIPPLDDGSLAYSVCCKNDKYPERLIYSYLRELNKSTLRIERIGESSTNKTNELNGIKNFKEDVKELLAKYDDFENLNRIAELEESAKEIANTIQDNIQILLSNKGILEALDGQAETLEGETECFLQESVQVKRKFWWKNIKFTLILSCVISLILIIVFANVLNIAFGNGISLQNLLKSNHNYQGSDNNHNIILGM
ncbi:synaptobrevin-like SNARE [Cryptosporidium canis]|uniref:Synaptobrevin-like SNARE n=1 Tax=Cryptosporidium canis TaxID=195482 RepID=A0ABQ8P589_9CRYT|nr:synaptobrevin-like SNARE [Cryptosporidium canis]KAJ1608806.1 synaptobrevin-like SNARE [Cryptosporidium canis]